MGFGWVLLSSIGAVQVAGWILIERDQAPIWAFLRALPEVLWLLSAGAACNINECHGMGSQYLQCLCA